MSFAEATATRDKLLRRWTTAGNEVLAIYNIGAGALTDPAKKDAFRGRYNILDRFYSRYEEVTEELFDLNSTFLAIDPETLQPGQLLTEFPDASQKKMRDTVRAKYMDCHEIHAKLFVSELATPIHNITLQNATLHPEGGAGGGQHFLPKVQLPKFDGSFENWVNFRDVYKSLIHTNASLSNIQKYHQLLGALTGSARSVISAVPLGEDTYETAWKSLESAYENRRVLATVYLNRLFNFKPITGRPTPDSLRLFLSQISDTVASFELLNIPNPCDFVLFSLAVRNLPQQTREEFEFTLKKDDFPSMTQLTKFVRERQLAVQLADPSSNFNSKPGSSEQRRETNKPIETKRATGTQGSRGAKTSLMTSKASKPPKQCSARNVSAKAASNSNCPICQDNHTLFYCVKFNNMTPRARFDALRQWSGCKLCLTANHTAEACTSNRTCRLCSLKHHHLLCIKTTPPSGANENASSASQSNTSLLGTTLTSSPVEATETQVVLATALVDVLDARGQYQKIRVVLDSASQYSYMTHKCLYRLGLKVIKTPRKISCLGGMLFDSAQGVASCELRSADQELTYPIEVVIVKNITSFLPTSTIPLRIRNKYTQCQLADPHWARPGPIDALIGADLFAELISGSIRSVGPNCPKVMPTVFGDVILGKYVEAATPAPATTLFSMNTCEDNVCFDLKRFWEIEDVPSSNPTIFQQEDWAETYFRESTYRLPDGKFGVRLPFSSPTVPDLSSSEQAARKRFYNLETKLQRDPQLGEAYRAFMQEYIDLGHMQEVKGPSQYIIPHHGVFNKIKLRVVFDGSAKTPNGSLNDHLLIGPPLQNDIRNIMTNFRAHQVAFVTDAVKMYRQIEVSPLDRGFQHIYWRENPDEPLKKYELNTVTYGLSCSPFLALRCLKALEQENQEQLPMAAQALSRDLYVDDVVSGHGTLSQAQDLQQQLITLMGKGGFQLAKWASNSPELVAAVAPPDRQLTPVDFSDQENSTIKVLGMQWDSHSDVFTFQVHPPDHTKATKRIILSTAAKIFDPLGLLSATVVLFKMLIQKLWVAGLNWDDPIPEPLESSWRSLIDKLDKLSHVKIPRCITSAIPYTYQLVGFADSSQQAMCATVYLRIITEDRTTVNLVTAKTKVAPTKTLTVPKLELCAALLLAKLVNSLNQFTDILPSEHLPPVYFTDSAVVLAWLKKVPTNNLKVFVSNRAAEIHNLTPMSSWRHVSTNQNPADLGSRGVSPDHLKNNALWWHGPTWLSEPEATWPQSKVDFPTDLPEVKNPKESNIGTSLLSCSALPHLIDWMARFSAYRRLIRVTALILRVIHNRKHPTARRSGSYLLLEIAQAFWTCVRLVQSYHFFQGDIKNLAKVQDTYQSLTPFLDDKGILRVGGRLRHSELPTDQKHQILLPHDSHFTILLVDFYHHAHFHPGPNLLQALIQLRIWVPGLRRLVRQRTRKCVKCFKLRADCVVPIMGDLPSFRVHGGRCFEHVGVDFAGPFLMKESSRRKAATSKVYMSLFICMATKALHLEAVTSLSTPAFLAALDRFMARRGRPAHIYSDCGTNFVGAVKELHALAEWYKEETTQNEIIDFTADNQIQWHFNPPYSPHFGGLWEAGVKSVKRHLYLVAGDTPLTYEEISTLFCKVEALLNSRPICPLSNDPGEANYLSPGHFLIGQPLLANPEPTLLDTKLNTLSRWQLIKRFTEDLWSRWRTEYLSTLQRRVKWHRDPSIALQVGDLVLIKSKDVPPFKWPMGKIVEVHPGADGKVRVVSLRTPNGVYKRSSANVVPLIPLKEKTFETNGEGETSHLI